MVDGQVAERKEKSGVAVRFSFSIRRLCSLAEAPRSGLPFA